MRVRIGPVIYEVELVDNLKNDEGEDLFGQAHHGHSTIRLNTANSSSQHFLTLWHEVFHCFENVYNLELAEEQITVLATAVVLALMDNSILRGMDDNSN